MTVSPPTVVFGASVGKPLGRSGSPPFHITRKVSRIRGGSKVEAQEKFYEQQLTAGGSLMLDEKSVLRYHMEILPKTVFFYL